MCLIHILQYMCMCFDASLVTYVLFVCLCVRVRLLPGGDLNLNTHRLIINHTMKFFENLKMQNVSCEG